MKTLILFFSLFVFGSNVNAQKPDSGVLYKKVLKRYLNTLPKQIKIDTFIVRKADYIPSDIPDLINHHYIKFLSEKEIDNYEGKPYPMIKMYHIKQDGFTYKMNMRAFTFDKKEKAWISPSISDYWFLYDTHEQKFVFSVVIAK